MALRAKRLRVDSYMKNLHHIAEKKIQASLKQILEGLEADIEATYRAQAANRSLKSGNTFINVMTLLTNAYKNLCDQIFVHHQWLLKESFFVSEDGLSGLARQAEFYGGQLQRKSAEHLEKAAKMVGHPNFYDRYMPDVMQTNSDALSEFKANLEGEAATKLRRGIKGLVPRFIGWVAGFVKGT